MLVPSAMLSQWDDRHLECKKKSIIGAVGAQELVRGVESIFGFQTQTELGPNNTVFVGV